jgi:hypothetical protein
MEYKNGTEMVTSKSKVVRLSVTDKNKAKKKKKKVKGANLTKKNKKQITKKITK